ncbi:hypothetical protein DVH24_036433 [Malus domestica]|uniref:Uncharacterized protein n=1 Tax=Malus domestica TaxID=3750 RepID=A0A498IJD3_MALDO|nr:hypothetical protein DVH24_036433 [Malus domestica]
MDIARGTGERKGPEARRVPLTREWERVARPEIRCQGPRAQRCPVTDGKPRGFPRSVRSQKV